MCINIYIYIYIYTHSARALALQHSVGNCSPPPDFAFSKLTFSRALFSGGVFFSQTPVHLRQAEHAASYLSCCMVAGGSRLATWDAAACR